MPGPNVKEDADRGSKPQVKLKKSERQQLIEYLRGRASYIDPTGRMHFQDGQTATPDGQMFYSGGGYSDGISFAPNPVKPALSNRHMPASSPPAGSLGGRYTLPPPPNAGLQAAHMMMNPDQLLMELARRSGFMK